MIGDIQNIKALYERVTFFKPIVSYKTSALQYDENVRRIMNDSFSGGQSKL